MTDKFDPARLRELHDVLRDNPFTMEFARTGYVYNPHERELTRYLIKHRADILAMADENAALKAEVARLREVLTEASGFIGNQKHSARGEELFNSIHATLAGGDYD